MNVDNLIEQIEKWGVDRNITYEGGATIQAQFSKGLEEMAEGFATLAKMNKIEKEIDESINAENHYFEVTGSIDEEGRNTRMSLVRGLHRTEDELKDDIGDVVVCMIQAARLAGFTLEECLEKSWEDIKDRRGTMVNGKFVKEE